MKRILFWVIALVMLTCTVAMADEFKLHSGVTFGMTAEEIIAKQSERGNTFAMNDGRLKSTSSISILDLDATIYYDFDADGKMVRQQFYFRDVNFAPLAREFEKVYGTPDCTSSLGTELVLPAKSFSGPIPTGQEFSDAIFNSSMVTGSRGDIVTYQWLVETDEGYTVIEEYGYDYYAKVGNNAKRRIGTVCLVDYRFFTKEEIENAQQENSEKYNDI